MRLRILAIILFLPVLAVGQDKGDSDLALSKVAFYLTRYGLPDASPASAHPVLNFVAKLDSKRSSFKRDSDFLEYLFAKTHQRFLKHYSEYPSFGETLNTGTYNCLTATALYALFLDHFQVDYEITETNYHIFLMAHTEEGNILIETTDPTYGFVTNAGEIERRIAEYRDEREAEDSSNPAHQYDFSLYNTVNLDQMLGLLHYNRSIAAYNDQDLTTSVAELAKAIESYQSPRIQAFSDLVLLAVLSTNMESSAKERCLQRLYAIRKIHYDISASAN